jgi:hypothetical protein
MEFIRLVSALTGYDEISIKPRTAQKAPLSTGTIEQPQREGKHLLPFPHPVGMSYYLLVAFSAPGLPCCGVAWSASIHALSAKTAVNNNNNWLIVFIISSRA